VISDTPTKGNGTSETGQNGHWFTEYNTMCWCYKMQVQFTVAWLIQDVTTIPFIIAYIALAVVMFTV